MSRYHLTTTGYYRDGRKVRVFFKTGRWWAHFELGRHAFGVFL